jgi:hypothetical protein
MAIRPNDLENYLKEWGEIQGNTFYGYAKEVVELLNNQLKEGEKPYNSNQVHRVVLGGLKDRKILAAIRQVLGINDEEMQKVDLSDLNLVANAKR